VIDALMEADQRPLRDVGCDGVFFSTRTGSTACACSAGGPVLWPGLDASLVGPDTAHALLTKPLVVSSAYSVVYESASSTLAAIVILDGLRKTNMPPGSRIEVTRGSLPVRWVRMDDEPFTDSLVTKLHLPIQGWRGPHR